MPRLLDPAANLALSPEVLEAALHATDIMIVLTDPHGDDNPIVWVNDYFCESSPALSIRAQVEPITFEDPREARHLYQIAQEAISNAAEHAEATEIIVTLHRSPGAGAGETVHLEVADDGSGIDDETLEIGRVESVRDRAELARRGMGLYGMRYRAELIGATLTVSRGNGGGTVVRCVLPASSPGRTGHRSRRGEQE